MYTTDASALNLRAMLGRERTGLALGGTILLLETAFALAGPLIAGLFARSLLSTGEARPSLPMPEVMILWAAVLAAQILARFAHQRILGRAAIRMIGALRMRLFEQLQFLPLAFFRATPRGELLSALTRDTGILGGFVTATVIPLAPQVLIFAGAVLLMIGIEPWVGAIAALAIPGLVVANRLLARGLRPAAARVSRDHAAYQGRLEENLSMMPAVKAFTREHAELARTRSLDLDLQGAETDYLRLETRLGTVIELLGTLAIMALLWIGVQALEASRMQHDDLVTLALYGLLLVRPVVAIGGAWGRLQEARGASTNIVAILARAREPDDRGKPTPGPLQRSLHLESLAFAYDRGRQVLDGLSLQVHRGEKIAIVGANGSGKTTLIHLLMRFLEPTAGRITLDGTDIRDCSLAGLRQQIALVDQSILLADASIADNIAYGVPDATRATITSAARAAQAWAFIEHLPHGLDTRIGPDGARLSGGQRQRLALARALIRQPSLLLLDEPTSMQDPAGETGLVAHIRSQLAELTCIVVTHRPETLALADRVLELRDGHLRAFTRQATPAHPT